MVATLRTGRVLSVAALTAWATVLAFTAGCDRGDAPAATPPPNSQRPPQPATTPAPAPLPAESIFLAQVDRTAGTKDCFSVIRDPVFLPADGSRGPHGVTGTEFVIGVDLGTARVCYPVLYLDFHEIVEHRMEGLALLACW